MERPTGREKTEARIEKEQVLEALRAKGLEDSEVKDLVVKWTEQQEALVEQENTSRAAIVFNIERSDLYVAAGDIEGAIDCLEDALVQAEQENEDELYDQIAKKIALLSSSENPGPNAEKQQLTKLEDLSQEQLGMYEQWMIDHPEVVVPPEKRREAGPEIAEFELLIDLFEHTHSLEDLHAISTMEEALSSEIRQVAKAGLIPIVDLFNKLHDETNITKEKEDELKGKYMHLSRAVGIINSGKVDHDR